MPNNSKDLIDILTKKRKLLKLTQNKLSKKANISHTSVARIENGEMNPTLTIFIELANQLGYDLILQDSNTVSEENELTTAINNTEYDIINDNLNEDILVLKRKNIRKN